MADLEWNGDAIYSRLDAAVKAGVKKAGELVKDEAVERAPIETGALRNSARVTRAYKTVAVSFGTGPSAPYAVKQHEEVGYHHKEGQAKFLESAMIDKQADVLNVIADEVRGAL